MADFKVVQTFIDHLATSVSHPQPKPKFFIGMSEASKLSDMIVCFVMNTERQMKNHTLNCNSRVQKFILVPSDFTFLTEFTSIMLNQVASYTLEEIYEYHSRSRIKFFEIAGAELCRQIKNCINFNFIEPIYSSLIKESFKNLR